MKKSLVLISCSLAVTSAFALPDYEPFADATASSGTSYTTGSALVGQTDAGGQSWFQAGGTSGSQPSIVAGDLTISGLSSAGGGESAAFGGNGGNARLNMSVAAGGITSGTVYYSFAMKLTDLTVLSTSGVFFAGLNNAQGSQSTTPNTVVSRLEVRSAGAGLFNVGIGKGSGTSDTTVAWGGGTFSTSDTVFVVGSYTFNTSSAADDVSQLWIDPGTITFGAASAPSGAISVGTGTDIARVASFVLYDRSTSEPTGQIDDLRIGLDWADVTPPVPEPATIAIGALGLVGFCVRRFRRG